MISFIDAAFWDKQYDGVLCEYPLWSPPSCVFCPAADEDIRIILLPSRPLHVSPAHQISTERSCPSQSPDWTRRFLFPLLCLCSATRHLTLYLANWSDLLNVAFMTFYLHDFIHSWVFTVWWWQLKSRLHRESRKKERSIISACTQSKCTRIPQLHRQCNQHDSLPLCVTVNL